MKFEWDKNKAESNFAKHKIFFELAVEVFSDPKVLSFKDTRKDYGEERFVTIGKVAEILILVVVHTDRKGKTRIISARRANRKERRKYDENNAI